MLLTPARMLPKGENWAYELLDGYRALATNSTGTAISRA